MGEKTTQFVVNEFPLGCTTFTYLGRSLYSLRKCFDDLIFMYLKRYWIMNDVIKRKGRQNKLGDLFRANINFHSQNALIYFFL